MKQAGYLVCQHLLALWPEQGQCLHQDQHFHSALAELSWFCPVMMQLPWFQTQVPTDLRDPAPFKQAPDMHMGIMQCLWATLSCQKCQCIVLDSAECAARRQGLASPAEQETTAAVLLTDIINSVSCVQNISKNSIIYYVIKYRASLNIHSNTEASIMLQISQLVKIG